MSMMFFISPNKIFILFQLNINQMQNVWIDTSCRILLFHLLYNLLLLLSTLNEYLLYTHRNFLSLIHLIHSILHSQLLTIQLNWKNENSSNLLAYPFELQLSLYLFHYDVTILHLHISNNLMSLVHNQNIQIFSIKFNFLHLKMHLLLVLLYPYHFYILIDLHHFFISFSFYHNYPSLKKHVKMLFYSLMMLL